MTQISKVYLKEMPELYLVSQRKQIDFFREYSDFVSESLQEIEPVMATENIFPSSGMITCFHNVDLANLDVEAGFFVSRKIADTEKIKCRTLPANLYATAIDLGEYEKQDPTMMALMEWIPKNGFQAAGGIYYHYLNEEEQPPENYLTQMFIPVKAQAE